MTARRRRLCFISNISNDFFALPLQRSTLAASYFLLRSPAASPAGVAAPDSRSITSAILRVRVTRFLLHRTRSCGDEQRINYIHFAGVVTEPRVD
jgi:hypothetical protein